MSQRSPLSLDLTRFFTLATAALVSSCATTLQQRCDYTKTTDAKIKQMTPPEKNAVDQILGAIPVVGTLAFAVNRLNEEQCSRAVPAPAPAASK